MASPDYLLEASWEICNKVGGIHTVITSKAEQLVKRYKDNLLLIGPYFADRIQGIFEELPIKEKNTLCPKNVCSALESQGIILHFGKWLIKGEPNVVLVDFLNIKSQLNDIKKFLWEQYKVDSLKSSYDYDEPLVWAYAVGKFIESIAQDKKICCQFHEWLSGPALLYLKSKKVKVATVFTTHATALGRSLSFAEFDLYKNLKSIDPDKKAGEINNESKHSLEKATAQNADVFTTVSEITGIEAEKILGRKPDVLVPNGLDLEQYPTFEDLSIEHRTHRDEIRNFLLYYFFPYYKFDIKNTLIYILLGRYEFRTKGIDIFIKSLSQLNKKLIKEKSEKTIISFIFVPANIRAIRQELLENKTNFKDIRDDLEEAMPEIEKNIVYNIAEEKELSKESLLDKELLFNLKKKQLRFAKKGYPQLSTHYLIDENDTVMKALAESDLNNTEKDRVKVIFYPIYLTGADGLLDLNFQQVIIASHLGIFPSYYEPWGYTPLECCANGVANITTDLAGFGRYIRPKLNKQYPGAWVIDRYLKEEKDAVKQLADVMHNFAKLSKKDRVENKIAARKVGELADWSNLIENYINAYSLAVSKKWS
ncbi:glycogen/starch synthase [Candidatus Woesearchaeota archaeon]|nr:glycogen/starch synthase [Candidatus Woesearchaeota archaeon]